MAIFTPLIDDLIKAFKCLPGVGTKSAQRMVLHLLDKDRNGGACLAKALLDAMKNVTSCVKCRNLTEGKFCPLCLDESRSRTTLCVVETPADLLSLEQSGGGFNGQYFVLFGRLSPIDGIGPEELGIDCLLERLAEGEVNEVILATNPTVEGEATAYYLIDQIKALNIKVSRIAHGVPVGGELEYIDGNTLAYALEGRRLC